MNKSQLTFSGLVFIPAELERTKKDLAALKEQAAGLTREYDRLLEEHAKAQVGGESREMDVNLAWEQALVTYATGRAFLRPQEDLGRVGERFTWGLELIMRVWKDATVFSSSVFTHECSILIGGKWPVLSFWHKLVLYIDDQTQTSRQLVTCSRPHTFRKRRNTCTEALIMLAGSLGTRGSRKGAELM